MDKLLGGTRKRYWRMVGGQPGHGADDHDEQLIQRCCKDGILDTVLKEECLNWFGIMDYADDLLEGKDTDDRRIKDARIRKLKAMLDLLADDDYKQDESARAMRTLFRDAVHLCIGRQY